MRLWHISIIPYLPKSQLIAQKRECDLIWKDLANNKKTNHILINYIWKYDGYERHLSVYYSCLEREFRKRGIKFNISKNATVWIGKELPKPFSYHQDKEYLLTCYFNLREKYIRGQKDFSYSIFKRMHDFVDKELDGLLNDLEGKI